MRKIHIFKAGEQISSTGFKRKFTEGDLQSMVDSFDPSLHEPPIRIGHEDSDKVPAFGWVKSLEKDGDNLYAYIDFSPEMEELIKKKHYRKVSASFYSPSSETNPKRGHYTLKHVAMLGGTPPAVKGLEPFNFSEEENGELYTYSNIEFNEEESPMGKKEKEMELLEEEKDQEVEMAEENKDLPEEDQEMEMGEGKKKHHSKAVAKEEEEAAMAEEEEELPEEEEEDEDEEMEMGEGKKKHSMDKEEDYAGCGSKKKKKEYSYSEELMKSRLEEMEAKFAEMAKAEEEAKAIQARLEEMEAKFAEMEAAKAEAEAVLLEERRSRRRESIESRVNYIYSEGKLTDGIYAQEDLFDFAVGLEEGTLEFSEGESPADVFLDILSCIPSAVSFSEVAPEEETVYSEKEEEEEYMEFSQRVEKYASENGLTFEKALRQLVAEYPSAN